MTKADRKELLLFLIFLSGAMVLFFWPILFQKRGFYYGDYQMQFYPWAKVVSDHLKIFSLPLWSPEIGCGFPLLAEGQSAALYPLHWVLFFFLPFPFSYHAVFIALFFLAGVFSFIFSKQIGVSAPGSALVALVYLFGSAYAGLAYGVMSLRVMAWLPLELFFVERLCRFGEAKHAVFLAVAWAMAFLGGYPQLASYSVLMGVLYFMLRLFLVPSSVKTKASLWVCFAIVLAAGISACQLLPTGELVRQSSRAAASLEFALQKSFNPVNLSALLWPGYEKFFGFGFFVGTLPICLVVLSFFLARKNRYALVFVVLASLFILLSFGSFNPLYVKLLQWTHFYFFRVPAKFLFFATFCLAVLTGMGLDFLLEGTKTHPLFLKIVRGVFLGSVMLYGLVFITARFLKPEILRWGEDYVRRMIYQKSGHIGSMEDYLARLDGLYRAVLERTSLTDVHFLGGLFFWGILFLILFWKAERFFERKNLVSFIIGLTLLELFSFSFFSTGFRGNQLGEESLRPDDEIEFLTSQPRPFRVYEMVTDPVNGAPHWLPNSKMLFGIHDIGIYTPLAMQPYRDFLKRLGGVDNASGALSTSKEAVWENLSLLSLMNVRFIATQEDFEDVPSLRKAFLSANGDIIYENTRYLPRAFLTDSIRRLEKQEVEILFSENLLIPNQAVEWKEYSARRLKLKVTTAHRAFLFLSEVFYPGWEARIDGEPSPIFKTNKIFRGLDVPSGSHEVELVYNPSAFKNGCAISIASLLICVGLLLSPIFRNRSR